MTSASGLPRRWLVCCTGRQLFEQDLAALSAVLDDDEEEDGDEEADGAEDGDADVRTGTLRWSTLAFVVSTCVGVCIDLSVLLLVVDDVVAVYLRGSVVALVHHTCVREGGLRGSPPPRLPPSARRLPHELCSGGRGGCLALCGRRGVK